MKKPEAGEDIRPADVESRLQKRETTIGYYGRAAGKVVHELMETKLTSEKGDAMNDYRLYNESTAPEAARENLKKAKAKYGFLPNLLAVMSESPALLESYLALGNLFDQTSFSSTEKQVILLAISRENDCRYCVAAHTTIAEMTKVPAPVIEAVRQARSIPDSKLEGLRAFVVEVVNTRGWPSEETTLAFFNAGYSPRHVLEVVLAVGYKTLSNYTNHIAETPLDAAFQAKEWEKAG